MRSLLAIVGLTLAIICGFRLTLLGESGDQGISGAPGADRAIQVLDQGRVDETAERLKEPVRPSSSERRTHVYEGSNTVFSRTEQEQADDVNIDADADYYLSGNTTVVDIGSPMDADLDALVVTPGPVTNIGPDLDVDDISIVNGATAPTDVGPSLNVEDSFPSHRGTVSNVGNPSLDAESR